MAQLKFVPLQEKWILHCLTLKAHGRNVGLLLARNPYEGKIFFCKMSYEVLHYTNISTKFYSKFKSAFIACLTSVILLLIFTFVVPLDKRHNFSYVFMLRLKGKKIG